jgi:hypothetical protein
MQAESQSDPGLLNEVLDLTQRHRELERGYTSLMQAPSERRSALRAELDQEWAAFERSLAGLARIVSPPGAGYIQELLAYAEALLAQVDDRLGLRSRGLGLDEDPRLGQLRAARDATQKRLQTLKRSAFEADDALLDGLKDAMQELQNALARFRENPGQAA